MRKLNLLKRKLSLEQRWKNYPHYLLNLPEVVLEGSTDLHTDEFGYILPDKTGDQFIYEKRAYEHEQFNRIPRPTLRARKRTRRSRYSER